MRKLSTLALAAFLAMNIISTNANAAVAVLAVAPPPAPKPGPSTPISHNDVCVVNCLQIVPPRPVVCPAPKGVVTLAPARALIVVHPKDPCASVSNEFKECSDKLDNLRRVTVAQVRRIDDNDKVHLVPLCDITHRSLTQVETTVLARGNIQGLIKPISENDTLMAALDDGGYKADNVLGIARGQNMVILYVSRAPR